MPSKSILIGCLIVSIAIVSIVVWLTPNDETADENSIQEVATSETRQLSMAETEQIIASSKKRLAFPTEPVSIETGVFKEELTDLATSLIADFEGDPGAYHFAARIFAELKSMEQAEAAWRACLALNPTAPGPYAGLAQLLNQSGREEEAIAILTAAKAQGLDSTELALELATAHENLGQLSKSSEVLSQAINKFAADERLMLALSRVLNQMQEFAKAESVSTRTLELYPMSEQAAVQLSLALVRQNKREQAVAVRDALEKLKKRQAGFEQAKFQDSYESALREIGQQAYLSAAAVAENAGQLEKAERMLRRSIEVLPTGGESFMSLSSVLRKLDRPKDALGLHQHLVEIQPNNVLNYCNLASVALNVGAFDYAKLMLEKGTKVDRDGVLSQTALAQLALAEGDTERARQLAVLVVERDRSANSFRLLANVYKAAGDNDSAAAAELQATELERLANAQTGQ